MGETGIGYVWTGALADSAKREQSMTEGVVLLSNLEEIGGVPKVAR